MENQESKDTENDCKEETEEPLIFSKLSSDSEINSDSFSDLNLQIEDLKENPSVFACIERLQKYIKKQDKKIKKLRSKLKHYKSKFKKKTAVDVSTQTFEEKSEPKTLSEEIKEVAENAMLQTGFVYEATSGMYYDYNTGYYYNAELGLYYDGNSGTYLIYNNETKTYDFHSQVDTVVNTYAKPESNGKRKKPLKEQDTKRLKNVSDPDRQAKALEDGECSSSEDEEDKENESLNSCCSSDEDDGGEVANSWPPCMRIMLKETSLPNLKVGALFIVTCDGGSLGREGDHAILIPDINVSKHHATISFDREANKYMIVDMGSRNGTILNGKRMSVSKQESEPLEVAHGSIVQIGNTKLLCHIHKGQQTCGHCEPGLVQVEEITEEVGQVHIVKKKNLHKKELQRLRKKFGIDTCPVYLPSGYSDRAENRRKFLGSWNPNEKTHVASVDESIASNNKGFKMLAKMGWSEGQSLGKEGTGLKEPIPLVGNSGTTGLGSAEQMPSDPLLEKKNSVWKKAQLRYQQVQEPNLDAFKLDESDEET